MDNPYKNNLSIQDYLSITKDNLEFIAFYKIHKKYLDTPLLARLKILAYYGMGNYVAVNKYNTLFQLQSEELNTFTKNTTYIMEIKINSIPSGFSEILLSKHDYFPSNFYLLKSTILRSVKDDKAPEF